MAGVHNGIHTDTHNAMKVHTNLMLFTASSLRQCTLGNCPFGAQGLRISRALCAPSAGFALPQRMAVFVFVRITLNNGFHRGEGKTGQHQRTVIYVQHRNRMFSSISRGHFAEFPVVCIRKPPLRCLTCDIP